MAKESNPFSNFLESWGTDPEAEAKGRVYTQTGRLKGEEANRMAGINAARKAFLDDPTIPHSVKMASLGRENMDAKNTMDATGMYHANQLLAPTDKSGNTTFNVNATPNELNLASILQGNAYSHKPPAQTQFVHNEGVIYTPSTDPKTGKISLTAVTGATSNSKQGGSLGQPAVTETKTPGVDANGLPIVTSQIAAAPMTGGGGMSPTEWSNIKQQRNKNDALSLGVVAREHPYGVYGYLMDKRLGRILPDGKINTKIEGLNPFEFSQLEGIAKQYEKAGYTQSDSFEAALKHFPDISNNDLKSREFGNSFWLVNEEKDSQGNELPNYGGGNFLSSRGLVYRDRGAGGQPGEVRQTRIPNGQSILPFEQNVLSSSNREDIMGNIFNGSVAPRTVAQLPDNNLIELGQVYAKDGRFYIGKLGKNNQVVPEEIINRNQ